MIKRGKQWPVYSFSPQMGATARAGHNLEPDHTVQISHAGGRDPGRAHSQGAGWEAEPPGLEPVVFQWCWLVSQTAPHLLCHSANSKPASNKTAFAAVVSPRWLSCRGCHSSMTELTVGGLGGTWWSHIQIRIKYDSFLPRSYFPSPDSSLSSSCLPLLLWTVLPHFLSNVHFWVRISW